MPALFAYLLSITVFIGAGCAGLVWLTEPPPARTSAKITVASGHARPKVRPEVVAAAEALPQDPAASPSDPVASVPDVPAQQPQAAVAAVSEPKPPAPEARQDTRQLPRQDPKQDDGATAKAAIAKAATDEAATDKAAADSAATDRADAATPVPAVRQRLRSEPEGPTADGHEQQGRGRETLIVSPKPAVSPKAANALARWFAERHAKPNLREPTARAKAASVHEASRPHFVMMTLRTIEYPDGHREQRLLPLR